MASCLTLRLRYLVSVSAIVPQGLSGSSASAMTYAPHERQMKNLLEEGTTGMPCSIAFTIALTSSEGATSPPQMKHSSSKVRVFIHVHFLRFSEAVLFFLFLLFLFVFLFFGFWLVLRVVCKIQLGFRLEVLAVGVA